MMLDIAFRCMERLQLAKVCLQVQVDAKRIAEEIAASVPFHLTANAQTYFHSVQTRSGNPTPGRPVGGLLMLHPLYVTTTCTVVPQKLRDYMLNQLIWVGKNCGIGQAALFANASISLNS